MLETVNDRGSGRGRTAFVTGATGAVGAALAHRLSEQGWKIVALHRPTSDVAGLRALDATLVEGDIAARDTIVGRVPRGTDAFFHVAANLNMWSRHNEEQMRVNVGGTRNAVEAALEAGVGRFVHTSTISAFGRHDRAISEATPTVADRSFVCYERSKWLAETEVRKGIARGLDAVILNPCAIMGPGFTGGWAILLHQLKAGSLKAMPPGVTVVNHVDEVARAHIAAFERGRAGENYILTGDRVPIPTLIHKAGQLMGIPVEAKVINAALLGAIARLAGWISYLTGKEPELTAEFAALVSQKLKCGTDKAQRELGYREVPWERCLEEMYQWLYERGAL